MKPFLNRHRDQHPQTGELQGVETASLSGCAQKELNLQPAGYKGIGPEPESPFRLRLRAREAARQARRNAEASCGNRYQSVTEAERFSAPSHKADVAYRCPKCGNRQKESGVCAGCGSQTRPEPFKLAKRPDILGFCEAVTLAAAMGSVKVWR